MSLAKVSLGSIAELDAGRLAEAFQQEIAKVEHDLKDRPGLKGARTVSLVMTAKPISDARGELISVDLLFDVKSSTPKKSSQIYNAACGRNGLHVNDLSPDDVRQSTLDDVGEPKAVAQ